jgi:hypothetical protein
MKTKLITLCGLTAPLLYAATVILGGALRPGYNHISQAISELIMAGAPNKPLLDGLFCLYNLLLAGFGVGLFQTAGASAAGKGSQAGRWAGVILLVTSALGVAMTLFFPMDPRGATATFPGTMHAVTAGLAALGCMLVILLTAAWLRGRPALAAYRAYSLVSVAVLFLVGGIGAYAAAANTPWMGLAERITIGSFVQWLLVISLALANGTAKIPAGSARAGLAQV